MSAIGSIGQALRVDGRVLAHSRVVKRQMKVFSRLFSPLAAIAATAAVLAASAGAALAEVFGQPTPWQMGMQLPVTPVGDEIYGFNTFLFWITTAIAVFVMVLL